jgi:hypothetical protein
MRLQDSSPFHRSGRLSRRRLSDRNGRLGRRLIFESLENRQLLANLGLNIQVWTDVGNQKGVELFPDANDEFVVSKGESIFLQVLAEDDRNNVPNDGVIGLPLNLTWNTEGTSRIRYSPLAPDEVPLEFPDPIALTNRIVTNKFPTQRFVEDVNVDSLATGLRGGTIPNNDGGSPVDDSDCVEQVPSKDECREFSLLRFTATTAGTPTRFNVALAGSVSFADGALLENNPADSVKIRVVDPSSLSGFVYLDTDRNGLRLLDANTGAPIELGVPNATISLFRQNDNTLLQTFVTGPDGFYHFEDLPPDTYRISQALPNCYRGDLETLGFVLPGRIPRGVAGQNEFTNINLDFGEHGIDYLFGASMVPGCINKRMFLNSTPPVQVTVAKLSGVNASSVQGTPGNDTISVQRNGQTVSVNVNGATQTFDTTQVKIVTIDAGGGTDIVTVTGTDARELIHLQPKYATLRRDDLPINDPLNCAIEILQAENVTVDAGPGLNDLAITRDSPNNDALLAAADAATINWVNSTLTGRARRPAKVRAISVAGGVDTATEQAHDYVLELLGDWRRQT